MNNRIIFFLFCFTNFTLQSQHISPYRSFFISTGLTNFRYNDQLNHGYVFRSYDLLLDVGYRSMNTNQCFEYSLSFGLGIMYKPDLVYATSVFIIPVKSCYAYRILKTEKSCLFAGPSFWAGYHFILIPQMHIGQLLWFTNYSGGVKLTYLFNLSKKPIKATFENNLLSFYSRPKTRLDPEFQKIDLFDWIAAGHKNMQIGTVNTHNQTSLAIEFTLGGKKNLQKH